jgi:pimeloyl-ACP methyl ester carboxylesterase
VPVPVEMPELNGVTHREVTVRGVRLHVAQAGSGPPLVLLHGWPQHWWSWRRMIGPLAERYTVIAPDLRGWGWSQAPAGDYAKADFAADIVALLDHEGYDRVRLIGHDWGGYTSFLLVLEHPDRFERMVALDIPPPWPSRPHAGLLGAPLVLSYQYVLASPAGPAVLERAPGFVRWLIRTGSGRRTNWTRAELDLYAEVLREPARARASAACYRTFLTRELPRDLRGRYDGGQLRVPTLLLMGGDSALRRISNPRPGPNLDVRVVPRAGHFLPEEAPGPVLDLATAFLAG